MSRITTTAISLVTLAVISLVYAGCTGQPSESTRTVSPASSSTTSPSSSAGESEYTAATPSDDATAAAAEAATVLHFKVDGMSCTGCERAVKDVVMKVAGVTKCEASHKAGTVVVNTTEPAKADEIAQAIADLDYTVEQVEG